MSAYVESLGEDSSDFKGLASTCTLALAEVLMHCGKWDKSLEAFEIALPVQLEVSAYKPSKVYHVADLTSSQSAGGGD